MKLSFIALAASSIFWLAQALPTIQPPQEQGQDLLYFQTRAEHHPKKHSSSNSNSTDHHGGNSTSSGLVPGKYFDRVVIIVFENKDYDTTIKDKYFKSLPKKHNGKHSQMILFHHLY